MTTSLTEREIESWAILAKPGDTLAYAAMLVLADGRAPVIPTASAIIAARRLYDRGIVGLVQQRHPDRRLSYVAQRTGQPYTLPERPNRGQSSGSNP